MDRVWKVRQFAAAVGAIGPQTSAPPPNEKNRKKELDVAKAIAWSNDLDQFARATGCVAQGECQVSDDDPHQRDKGLQ